MVATPHQSPHGIAPRESTSRLAVDGAGFSKQLRRPADEHVLPPASLRGRNVITQSSPATGSRKQESALLRNQPASSAAQRTPRSNRDRYAPRRSLRRSQAHRDRLSAGEAETDRTLSRLRDRLRRKPTALDARRNGARISAHPQRPRSLRQRSSILRPLRRTPPGSRRSLVRSDDGSADARICVETEAADMAGAGEGVAGGVTGLSGDEVWDSSGLIAGPRVLRCDRSSGDVSAVVRALGNAADSQATTRSNRWPRCLLLTSHRPYRTLRTPR